MTYERCVRLGRWALLIALVPVLAFAFLTTASSSELAILVVLSFPKC